MKTTVEIADQLLKKAKRLAARRRTTLRSIIEQGIRITLRDQDNGWTHALPDRSIDGKGLQTEFRIKGWSDIRDTAYESRGS